MKPQGSVSLVAAFLLIPDVCPVALDVIFIPQRDSRFLNNVGNQFFHLCAIRYHVHFSGERSAPVTCNKSRKNWMTTCICSTRSSSSAVSSVSSMDTGFPLVSLDATPVIVSSKNKSPGLVLVLLLSTDTSVMH
jgi:hypothetical protein